MAATAEVWYEPIVERKSSPTYTNPDKKIVRELDELERISTTERDKKFGSGYFEDIEQFFDLEDDPGTGSNTASVPTFRPRVAIPQLQTLILNEATDITDSSPKIYISNQGQREKGIEKSYQENWRQNAYNNRILESLIWAMLAHSGYLQVGFSPTARRGKGNIWIDARNPKSVKPDPYAKDDSSWSWVLYDDWMYVDEIRRLWPEKGILVKPHYYSNPETIGSLDRALDFPGASPLSQQSEYPSQRIYKDNRARVRTAYLFSNTREKIKEASGTSVQSDLIVPPKFQFMFPDGRWITECEGVILADGNNWCPKLPNDERGTFPLIRIAAMPSITGFWGPAPIRYTRQLQELAARMYTQAFENSVRLSNGQVLIDERTGMTLSDWGGLPAEVHIVNPGTVDGVKILFPQTLPQHMVQLPQTLLAMQKELQGFSPARSGEPGAGNISPDLFDASLFQSQYMTRLRGRLLSESIQRLAQVIFYCMMRYLQEGATYNYIEKGEVKQLKWHPSGSLDSYDIMLDPGSIRVMSAAAMRSVVAALAKANLLPTEYILEALDLPNASAIAEQKTRELELAALAKLRRPR